MIDIGAILEILGLIQHNIENDTQDDYALAGPSKG